MRIKVNVTESLKHCQYLQDVKRVGLLKHKNRRKSTH